MTTRAAIESGGDNASMDEFENLRVGFHPQYHKPVPTDYLENCYSLPSVVPEDIDPLVIALELVEGDTC